MAKESFGDKSRKFLLLRNNRIINTKTAAKADAGYDLAKATARAAQLLGLTGAALARTIGVSEPTVPRIINGEKAHDPLSKEGELSLLLARVYRSLDPPVGTDDQKRKDWMRGQNKALGDIPIKLI